MLISHLRHPAPAMAPRFVADVSVIHAPMDEIVSMSPEEYAARVIGRICEFAAQGTDDRGMLVNYTQLPEAAWGKIARRFGAGFSADEIARMQAVASHDAKRPRRRFEADGESKRLEVSGAAREAAARWISPHFDQLERLRTAAGIP